MHAFSRRDFIATSAASLAALQAGRILAADDRPAEMAIAKWAGEKNLPADQIDQAAAKMAQKAIEALGGMKRFVKAGDVVWVKPNIGWDRKPEQAGNTNPQIVAAIVQMCLAAGAKTVKVGDNPVNVAQKTYVSSGISAAAEKAGASVVFLDKSRFRKTGINGNRLKELPVYPEITECDVIINVPIIKHHSMSKLTMCMKNLMGVIDSRQTIHQDIPTCLADLTRFMQPRVACRCSTPRGCCRCTVPRAATWPTCR